jgi:lipoprotein NlpI
VAVAAAEAISLFEQAIAIDPNFANVYALLGLCH